MIGRPPRPLRDRFDAQHVKDAETGCWVWTSALDRDGYGYIADESKRRCRAHRIAYSAPTLFPASVPMVSGGYSDWT